MLTKKQLNKFHKDGFLKFEVSNKIFLRDLQKSVFLIFKKFKINKSNLQKRYHKIFVDNKEHHKIQSQLQRYILDKKINFKLIEYYKDYFNKILGLDICATNSVNFRVVRPTKNIDNINYHRDTDLGHTPFEVNVWVPLFDTKKNNSLHILPKSHLKKINFFKFNKVKTEFKRGSKENRLGYFYRSFKFKNLNNNSMRPIKCNFGEILIFYSSCMHGTKNNLTNDTRFSFDFNISNSFFPIKWKHHGNENKYTQVLKSNIVVNAKKVI